MSKVKRKAVVDKEYCVACGTCVKACPLKIINICTRLLFVSKSETKESQC